MKAFKAFLKPLKAFIKPFEAAQRSVSLIFTWGIERDQRYEIDQCHWS